MSTWTIGWKYTNKDTVIMDLYNWKWNDYFIRSAQNGSKIRGNIHTGATPPWLRDDDDDDDGQGTSKTPIGPSEDDFRKWSE